MLYCIIDFSYFNKSYLEKPQRLFVLDFFSFFENILSLCVLITIMNCSYKNRLYYQYQNIFKKVVFNTEKSLN